MADETQQWKTPAVEAAFRLISQLPTAQLARVIAELQRLLSKRQHATPPLRKSETPESMDPKTPSGSQSPPLASPRGRLAANPPVASNHDVDCRRVGDMAPVEQVPQPTELATYHVGSAFPTNSWLQHERFGPGYVFGNEPGIMHVRFLDGEVRFLTSRSLAPGHPVSLASRSNVPASRHAGGGHKSRPRHNLHHSSTGIAVPSAALPGPPERPTSSRVIRRAGRSREHGEHDVTACRLCSAQVSPCDMTEHMRLAHRGRRKPFTTKGPSTEPDYPSDFTDDSASRGRAGMDASPDYSARDHGQYGSHPSYDGFDDESGS
jgi:hypothetical protein